MSDLRLIGKNEDGSELELKDQDGATYSLRISDHLRALVNQPRLVAVATPGEKAEATVSVKDVQARLRLGESAETIARATGWSIEKIEKFSGPIMQERAYIIERALASQLTKEKHSATLAGAAIAQLSPRGVDMEQVEWNTWRNAEGTWNIVLYYPSKDGGQGQANWSFDIETLSLTPEDDGAAWIAGEEKVTRPATPTHGIVPPRLVAVREESVETVETLVFDAEITEPTPVTVIEDVLPEDAKRDGVTKRLKIPSWDDIMFGGKKDSDPQSDL